MQSSPSLIRFLLFIPACGFFILVISQDLKRNTEQIRNEYMQAVRYYQQANELANSPSYNEKTEMLLNRKALDGLKNVLPALSGSALRSDSMMFRVYAMIGELEHYFDDHRQALEYYSKAIAVQPHSGLPDSVIFKPLLYSGIIYYNRGKLDSAASFFLRSDTIQQHYQFALNESQRLYNTLGVLSYEAGDYRQAKNYFKRALELIRKDDAYSTDLKSNYLINLAQMQVKLQEYDEAYSNNLQLLLLKKNLDEVYYNMAMIRVEQGRGKEALELLNKVKFEGSRLIRLYNGFARAYLLLEDKVNCRYYLNKGRNINEDGEQDLAAYGITLKLMGNLAAAEDSAELAIRYYTRSINCFYPAYQDSIVDHNPREFQGFFSYINLYQVMIDKALAWHQLFEVSDNMLHTKNELDTYLAAYRLLDHVMETYETDEARIFINRSRYKTHDQPISVAFELYSRTRDTEYLKELYTLDQQNKATVLALNAVRVKSRTNDTTEQQIGSLKKQITRLVLKSSGIKDSGTLKDLNKQILDLELELAKIRSRNTSSPDLRDHLPSVRYLRNEVLDDRTALVSYHLTSDHITTTLITRKKFGVVRKKLKIKLSDTIQGFVSALRTPGAIVPGNVSNLLYHLLFDEVLAEDPERLIIIPDDELSYLPFESLQDDQGKYAVEHFSIQYQYSTAFLEKQGAVNNGSAISFAPFASDGAGQFSALPFSGEEVKDNRGSVYIDTGATKNLFLEKAGESGLVHLATHAKAEAGTAGTYLVFRNKIGEAELLFEEEIYNLNLKETNLVILSACETGSGELMKGEGIMSLSRAFTYAGCKNIITSLWKADDRSTSYITKRIHHYLEKDYSIDKAIRQAKLDLLKEGSLNPRLKHPYYWSHLIFIGTYQPGSGIPWKLFILSFLAALIMIVLYRYRKRL